MSDAAQKSPSCVGFARRPGQLSCYILELPDVDGDQAISLIQEGSFPDFAGRDSVVIHRKRLNSTIDVCEESDCQRITTKRACEEAVSGLFTEGQVLYVDSPCVALVNTKTALLKTHLNFNHILHTYDMLSLRNIPFGIFMNFSRHKECTSRPKTIFKRMYKTR